ncbi:hypothetical protein HAHE_25510 [Haloferula helveola]|uniref:DUF6797 domain-containing protein n=1 Tax=Haloferula helveola TaxID=490095 RepID=A0ABM7RN68_9BACT|nr:hypothetical protein HAHE_25510 [Haloferula helveola]
MRLPKLLTLLPLTASLHAAQWYEEMQIGPAFSSTFADTYQGEERVAAVKGILIDLGDGYRALFDTETLRYSTVYKGGLQWGGTPWTGAHGQLVKLANEEGSLLTTASGTGWADGAGSFEDKRPIIEYTLYTQKRKASKSEGPYGNVDNASFKGFYRHGSKIVLDYEVNGTRILDHPAVVDGRFVRYLQVAPHSEALVGLIADGSETKFTTSDGASVAADKNTLVTIAPSDKQLNLTIATGEGAVAPISLDSAIKGGPGLWQGKVETEADLSKDTKSPWVVDTITLPDDNPWKSKLRFGGFDFIDDNTAALSTWNGDVWVVSGIKEPGKLTWTRFAAGLFEPLGVKVVDGTIYVNGRDQITRLKDLNGDGEADHFEAFNRDVTVSPNFHEFAFDLQTDAQGNFYFSKAAPVRPGGRNFDAILPNHGTVIRVSPDGSSSEVIATGLRAPGGVGVGPNGEITTGENEGTWQPCCKINFMKPDQRPLFFGTEQSRQDLKDAPYTEPLCYLPMDVDNSGGSQVWVPKEAKWGLQAGEMLHLSYGQSTIYRVLPETVNGTLQGGVVPVPVKLRSSAMRARFHPDGSLYVLGFRGWQTNAASECAFHRIRYTGKPVTIPDQLHVTPKGVRIHFEVPLDEELATDPTSYSVQRWDYVRGPQYGSGEFSVDNPDEEARKVALGKESKGHKSRDNVKVTAAKLLDDGQTVEIELEGHKPSMQLKVSYDLETDEGDILNSSIHSTVREIPN